LRNFRCSLDYLITHAMVQVQTETWVPGALGVLIGLAPHTLVSAPSRLPILRSAFGGLGSGLPGTL